MRGRPGWGAALAAATIMVAPGAASADTFEVTRTGDPVPGACKPRDCSLREAVTAANARPGADRVVVPRARYELTRSAPGFEDANLHGDLDVTSGPLTIVHPARGRATIDANGNDRVLQVVAGRTTLARLGLVGGISGDGDGGAVLADAPLTLSRAVIAGNRSVGNDAGAIKAGGPLTVQSSKILWNRADGGGGAIFAVTEDLTVSNTRIVANRASNNGGGIVFGAPGGRLVISRSTLADNRTDADGGGLYAVGAEVRVTGSTIAGNRAEGGGSDGGGLYADGPTATIVNSTVASNRATIFGGGIHAQDGADVSLNAVTVARNVADADGLIPLGYGGGGLYRLSSAGFDVRNSLIALNRSDTTPNDCDGGPFDSLGHNLLSTTSAGACQGFDTPTDLIRANPRLGALADHGGPTKTVSLKRGSPAIGRAHRASAPGRDQRGRRRDRRPDIGSFERGA